MKRWTWEDMERAPLEPTTDVGCWLAPGPDKMPLAARDRLDRLKHFHLFSRQGTMEFSRAAWLDLPEQGTFFGKDSYSGEVMRHHYHPKLIRKALDDYRAAPFLALIPKSNAFFGDEHGH